MYFNGSDGSNSSYGGEFIKWFAILLSLSVILDTLNCLEKKNSNIKIVILTSSTLDRTEKKAKWEKILQFDKPNSIYFVILILFFQFFIISALIKCHEYQWTLLIDTYTFSVACLFVLSFRRTRSCLHRFVKKTYTQFFAIWIKQSTFYAQRECSRISFSIWFEMFSSKMSSKFSCLSVTSS